MTTSSTGRYWPWGVAGALLFTVAANVVMAFAASDGNASVVEPDYYRKAVEWDATMARRAASDRLGWRVVAAFSASAGDSSRLSLGAAGADSQPVRGARFVAELIHNRAAATPIRVELRETAPGSYDAWLKLPHRGLWEVRVSGRRGAERFETSMRVEAAGARRSPE